MTTKFPLLAGFSLALAACLFATSAAGETRIVERFGIAEQGTVGIGCYQDCDEQTYAFPARWHRGPHDFVTIENAIVVIAAHGADQTLEYCLTYFQDIACAQTANSYGLLSGVWLTFPCGRHEEGFLIRGSHVDGDGHDLPSTWLAYVDGETYSAEGETADAILALFTCEAPRVD